MVGIEVRLEMSLSNAPQPLCVWGRNTMLDATTQERGRQVAFLVRCQHNKRHAVRRRGDGRSSSAASNDKRPRGSSKLLGTSGSALSISSINTTVFVAFASTPDGTSASRPVVARIVRA